RKMKPLSWRTHHGTAIRSRTGAGATLALAGSRSGESRLPQAPRPGLGSPPRGHALADGADRVTSGAGTPARPTRPEAGRRDPRPRRATSPPTPSRDAGAAGLAGGPIRLARGAGPAPAGSRRRDRASARGRHLRSRPPDGAGRDTVSAPTPLRPRMRRRSAR